jgi:hypothetical protein
MIAEMAEAIAELLVWLADALALSQSEKLKKSKRP